MSSRTSPSTTRRSTITLHPQPPPPPSLEAVVVKKLTRNPSRRSTISGFLPLSPISASPICTPTTSTSSRNFSFCSGTLDGQGRSDSLQSTESFATAPTTPSDSSLFAAPPPTWISTPPTPPPKVVKRSVTCMPRPLVSPVISSASFPASSSPHARAHTSLLLQRRASTSSIPSRARSVSADSPAMHPTSFGSKPESVTPIRPSKLHDMSHKSDPVPIAGPRQSKFTQNQQPNIIMDHYDHDFELDKKSDCGHSVESTSSGDSGRKRLLREKAKAKDCDRRYHALMELLSTEVSYLQDLRVLVSVYLRNVPTLTRNSSTGTFGRNSSLSALSRNGSYTQLTIGMSGPGSFGLDFHGHGLQPMSSIHSIAKDKEKSPTRHLFTDTEVEILTRNAEDVLEFHERFVEELQLSMSSLGIPMDLAGNDKISQGSGSAGCRPGIDNMDAGIAIISTKFATESSRFNLYQKFCAGHPEALDILRRVQQLYPVEWDLFEQRCGDAVTEQRYVHDRPKSAPHERVDVNALATVTPRKQRRASITAIDQTVWTLRGRTSAPNVQHPKDTQTDATKRPRLFFMDYLIKPVQRICKYPLLLDQLKTGKSQFSFPAMGRTDVSVVVESAALAMRHVAGEVDEARRRQDVAARSSLIISRTSVATISTISTSISSQPLQALTSSFLSSLGTCLFAGSLDVIHNRSTKISTNLTSINVKYLGAFLYAGGYLILVKVLKGKVYEPRHWFKLSDFQISDPEEMAAWLPCSFRLSRKDHEFELAAACQAEKISWMSMIRESFTCPIPAWINEPLPSLQLDRYHGIAYTALEGPPEALNILPTIQSMSELSKDDESESAPLITHVHEGSPTKPKTMPRSGANDHPHPSRHSSSASARSILSPNVIDSDTIIIRRCLPTARAQVDLGLQDVISDQCLTARSYAAVREGGLFQAPHISRSGTSRSSNSALSMKLKKHESVRVDRRSLNDDSSKDIKSKKSLSRPSRRRPKTLSLTSISSEGIDSLNSHYHYQPSPPFSRYSFSTTNSNPTSRDNSPVNDFPSFQTPASSASFDTYKRAHRHSLVGSVRSLFLTKSPVGGETSPSSAKHSSSNILRRWVKGSHRRANTAPESLRIEHSTSKETSQSSPVLPQIHMPQLPSDCSLERLTRTAHS
ncbi:hypothetical protein E1B28_004183 [Marasmius oreades]|uniref:DH domain-containing protein n=1 Tax=Marasmius oreades TaxID=181124 RepID=A0A9P7UY45_9AGAR|nr:uncharacterized protein E1B28_004183 [Marasmius oreades]KAG7096773.1 hypothetical protein E1B28_004183 [Marasmius oreades]